MSFEGREINQLHKDESLREKNFKAFEEVYGIRLKIDPDEDKQYRMETAKNGEAVLFIKGALKAGDLRLNSLYDPSYESKRLAMKQKVQSRRTTVVIMGFSTGSYLRALLDNYRPDTTFFVYEPSESLFSFVCSYIDLTYFIKHVRISIFVTDKQHMRMADAIIQDVASHNPETTALVTPFYSQNDVFEHICHELESVMASAGDFQKGRARVALVSRMYAWNHMRNNMVFTELKERIPKGIPAVIVSAGPSLNKNVHLLKEIKGHAFIMCTDRALRILDEHDIVPDVVVTMDAEKSPDYLKTEVAKNTYLLCSYQTNKETQRLFDGRCIYFHGLKYERELLGDKVGEQVADLGGNVAGGSFVLCEMLGIKTIILVGQDLAFIDGKHHADDVEEGNPDIDAIEVEGVDGKPVVTNEMWIAFRDFFERQINLFPDIRVIDSTEGGALIHGSEVITLRDVADNVCIKSFDLDEVFIGMAKAQTEEEYQEAGKKLDKWVLDLDVIQKNSKELEDLCSQLIKVCKYQDINDPKYNKKKEKLAKLKIEMHMLTPYGLLEDFWVQDIYSLPDLFVFLRNNEEAKAVLEPMMEFYKKLPEDCLSLKEELLKAIEEK